MSTIIQRVHMDSASIAIIASPAHVWFVSCTIQFWPNSWMVVSEMHPRMEGGQGYCVLWHRVTTFLFCFAFLDIKHADINLLFISCDCRNCVRLSTATRL